MEIQRCFFQLKIAFCEIIPRVYFRYYLNFYALPTLPILKLQNLDIFTTMEDMNIEQNAEAKTYKTSIPQSRFRENPE